MIAEKLKPGDEIRIISPSRSLTLLAAGHIELSRKQLEQMGFKVTFSKHANETDEFDSSFIESRIVDLHAAFLDPNVKGILTIPNVYADTRILQR